MFTQAIEFRQQNITLLDLLYAYFKINKDMIHCFNFILFREKICIEYCLHLSIY